MPIDPWTGVTRADNTTRVQSTDPRRRRERKEEGDKEFSDLLQESEKDTEEFVPEHEEESRPNVPTTTLLNMLSTGTPPMLNIKPIEEDAAKPEKKPEQK